MPEDLVVESVPLVEVKSPPHFQQYLFNGQDNMEQVRDQLFEAIYFGDEDGLENILGNNFRRTPQLDLSVLIGQNNYTPLHHTTFTGPNDRKKKVRDVLAKKILDFAETNGSLAGVLAAQDSLGNTPLHHAAEYKRFGLVDLFLKYGANPWSMNKDEDTPIHLMADGKGKVPMKVMQTLLESAVKLNPDENAIATLIFEVGMVAASSGAEDILKMLIEERNLDLDRVDLTSGFTVAHCCVVGGQKFSSDFLKELIGKVGNQIASNAAKDSLLHLAAKASNVDVLTAISSSPEGIPIGTRNLNGNKETPFHCAIQGMDTNSVKCLEILLRMWKFFKLPEYQMKDFMAIDGFGKTIVRRTCENKAIGIVKYITTVKFDGLPHPWFDTETLGDIYGHCPVAILPLLDKQIQTATSEEDNSPNKLTLNYACLMGYADKFQKHSLDDSTALHCTLDAAKPESVQVLAHPLVKLFLQEKWHKLKYIGYAWLVFQIFLVLSYNILTTTLYGAGAFDNISSAETNSSEGQVSAQAEVDSTQEKSNSAKEFLIFNSTLVTILVSITLVKELSQMISYGWRYWKSLLNWLQLFFIGVAALVAYDGFANNYRDFDTQVGFSAFGSFISAFLLLRDFGRLPGCERYFEVFVKVIRSSLKVLAFYIPCLMAFSLSFQILLKKDDTYHLPFGFVKILSMAVGELDYEKIHEAEKAAGSLGWFIQIMYLTFAFLAAIVLINLLIAFAVSDIQALLQDAETSRLASQLRLLYEYEQVLRAVALTIPPLRGIIERNCFLDSFEKVKDWDLEPELQHQLGDILSNRNKPAKT